MDIFQQLSIKLKEHSAQCSIISADHIPELESEIVRLYKDSFIDEEFYRKYLLDYFYFSIAEKQSSIQSLIIIATPSPPINIKFNINRSVFRFKIPPTYSDKIIVNGNIKNITSQLFDDNGYKTIPVVLPKKLIAVHSGLAKFGKNNICYVPGMGSYNRITLFGSDLPCIHDYWQELKILDQCNNCKACLNHCPTNAIEDDKFIINAVRCLTHYNEQIDPFPEWIENKWHNSIVGCMRCQDICPVNQKDVDIPEKEDEFSNSETNLILKGGSFEELPIELQVKIKNLCMDHYYHQISRNLAVLIDMNIN